MKESDRKGKKKRPYSPPKIRSEKLYERNALACGKVDRRTYACLANLRRS
jgi:hypothetical protein